MFWHHHRGIIAIFVVFIIYKLLVLAGFTKWVKNIINPDAIPNQVNPPTLFDRAKKDCIEFYYCSVLVSLAYFAFFQFPQVSGISNFADAGRFLFTPPLKYLIIGQVAVGLVLGLLSLPHMTLERIITPFGQYGVKKIEEVTNALGQEVDKVRGEADRIIEQIVTIYRIRLSMLQAVTSFGIFKSNNEIDEDALGDLTTYIERCYNAIYSEAVRVCAVRFYEGNLDFSKLLEIPNATIMDAFIRKDIVASNEGILPAEVAVPLQVTGNSYVVVHLRSETVCLNREDGETVEGLWRYIRDVEMVEEKKGLQGKEG